MTLHVLHGDATALPLADCSVDAAVCDPPYGLEFMGKDWDAPWRGRGVVDADEWNQGTSNPYSRSRVRSGRSDSYGTNGAATGRAFAEWSELWAAEAFRVLKPGGHLLAFGGSRTWHRLACAIEDAGFELRDSIAWLYGSGFPKSLDVSKAIDKAAGAERKVIGTRRRLATGREGYRFGEDFTDTAPALDAARQWQGWGTALKPAFEPIVVARKPLDGTVAGNVQRRWGTGALNIDGCRVYRAADDVSGWSAAPGVKSSGGIMNGTDELREARPDASGRWPSNVVLTHGDCDTGCEPGCPVAMLDQQSGTLKSGGGDRRGANEGGASRFFPTFRYQAKAPARERPEGPDGTRHPTCKPLELMRWLVRLVTPPGGLVLDMFAGSGATGEACLLEGFDCLLIEKHAPYLPLIEQRRRRSTPTEVEPMRHAPTRAPRRRLPSLGGQSDIFDAIAEAGGDA